MHITLENKLQEIKDAEKAEAWYITKQKLDFCDLCYLTSFQQEYLLELKSDSKLNFDTFIQNKANQFNKNSSIKITTTYRALIGAVFFGLLQMQSSTYKDATTTETFNEITKRCNGKFENKETYKDIIERQIEKFFISSEIDEKSESIRKDFRVYPAILLYKILLELGYSEGEFCISMDEYNYLVATTKEYKNYLETVLLILQLRNNPEQINKFKEYRDKVDNRVNKALEQLETLEFKNNNIYIKEEYRLQVALKVFAFEQNYNLFITDKYLDFLGSSSSLFEVGNFNIEALKKSIVDPKYLINICSNTNTSDPYNNEPGTNILLYGLPGVGKSYWISQHLNSTTNIERIVFHPEYDNSDFIGQLRPITNESGIVNYKFIPGSFARVLKKAIDHPENHYFLIIEELNRGNAPSIFGEVFQLLDRDKTGQSQYSIHHIELSQYIYNKPDHIIYIPKNCSIIATMNTADQNIFTLDTAFQRRWNMHLIENDIDQCSFKNTTILNTTVTWEHFNKVINSLIIEYNNSTLTSEDKRLGAYFISENVLTDKDKDSKLIFSQCNNFAEKVLKYLWDDVFKLDRESLFNDDYKSLDQVIKVFNTSNGNDRFRVFNQDVLDLLIPKQI